MLFFMLCISCYTAQMHCKPKLHNGTGNPMAAGRKAIDLFGLNNGTMKHLFTSMVCVLTFVMSTRSFAQSCIPANTQKLPYNQKHLPGKARLLQLPCSIKGREELSCGEGDARYLPLPDFGNVRVILVPLDCGDFEYRWYLLTIVGNKVTDSEYAEGLWFEPDNDAEKEHTRFSIDAAYKITIVTEVENQGKRSVKSKAVYQLQQNGKLRKL